MHEYYTKNREIIHEKQNIKYQNNLDKNRKYFRDYYHNVIKPKQLKERLKTEIINTETINTEIEIKND